MSEPEMEVVDVRARYAVLAPKGSQPAKRYRMRMVEVEETPKLAITDETTVGEVCQALNAAIEREGMEDGVNEGGLGPFPGVPYDAPFRTVFPGMRWIACFPVRGTNEGWYLHVDAICSPMDDAYGKDIQSALWSLLQTSCTYLSRTILMGKTFSGMRECAEVAARLSELLEDWDW
jgi:hypothetical protein